MVYHSGRYIPDEERRKWQNPEAILYDIGLKLGDTFVDIGCGNGYFAIPASRIVGNRGLVYGLDVNINAIEEFKKTAVDENLSNIEVVIGKAETTVFCDTCADIVFFGIDLHDFQDPLIVLRNAHRMLKSTGKLVDIDWQRKQMPFGPPFEIRFSSEKAKILIEKAGFEIGAIEDIKPYYYMIVARPA